MTAPHDRSLNRVRQTAAVYVVIGMLDRSLGFLVLPFVTRLLDPTEYGQVSVVMAVLALVGIVLAASIETPLFRAVARSGPDASRVVRYSRTYLVWILPSACIASGLVVFALLRASPMGKVWGVGIAGAGFNASLGYFGLPMFRASDRLRAYIGVAVPYMLLDVVLKLLLLASVVSGPLGWVTADLCCGVVAWALVAMLTRHDAARLGTPEPSDLTVRSFARTCADLVPHRLSFWALTTLSRPALALVASSRDVGLYSLALNLANVSMMLLAEFNRSVLIEYSREEFPAPTSTRPLAQAQVVLALLVPGLLALGISAFGVRVIGSDYHASIPLSGVLLVGQAFYGLYLIPANYLSQTAGIFKRLSQTSVVGGVVTFAIILVAGASWNMLPVSLGSVFGFATMLCLAMLLLRRSQLTVYYRQIIPPWRLTVPLLLSFGFAIASTITLDYWPHWIFAGIAITGLAVAAYSATLIAGVRLRDLARRGFAKR